MSQALFIIAVVALALLALIFLPRLLLMRALSSVIKIFRQHQAVSDKNAKTIDELGFRPPTFTQRMFGLRNYKPQALNLLRRADIVQMTEDGRLYLSEDRLASSELRNR